MRYPTRVWAGVAAGLVLLAGVGVVYQRSRVPRAVPAAAQDTRAPVHPGEGAEDEHHEEAGPLVLAPEAVEALEIQTLRVEERPLLDTVEATGTVVPDDDRVVHLHPLVRGTIRELHVSVGDRVKRGQPIATLHSVELAEAFRTLREAEARLELARENLAYQKSLAAAGAFTRAPWEEARKEKAAAEQEVAAARAEAERAGAELAWARDRLERVRKLAEVGEFQDVPYEQARDRHAEAVQKLEAAQAELDFTRQNEERLARLYEKGVAALRSLQEARAARRQAEAAVAHAQQEVEVTRSALEREEKIRAAGVRVAGEVQAAQTAYFTAEKSYNEARARLQQAEERLRVAEERLRREEGIYRQDILASRELRRAEAEYRQAEVAYRSAREALVVLGASPDAPTGATTVIHTPIDGVVMERPVNQGQAVSPETLVARIVDLSTVWVDAAVSDSDLARVRRGLPVRVTSPAFPATVFEGTVFHIGGDVSDARTRTVPVRASIRNPGGQLRAGMFVRVALAAGEKKGLAVPAEAVQTVEDEPVVFVKTGPRTFERRVIETGRTGDGWVEVRSGLQPGEEVVIRGAFDLVSALLKEEIGEGHAH